MANYRFAGRKPRESVCGLDWP
jgi:hypothetical protein